MTHRRCWLGFLRSSVSLFSGVIAFAYSTDLAEHLARQLDRLTSLHPHQLAGQAAIFDFWVVETRHCLSVMDDYPRRFERMAEAQTRHVARHDTKLSISLCGPGCTCCGTVTKTPPPPVRIPDREFKFARRGVCGAFRRFIDRAFYERLIDEDALRSAYAVIGMVDGYGLPAQSPPTPPQG